MHINDLYRKEFVLMRVPCAEEYIYGNQIVSYKTLISRSLTQKLFNLDNF